ncbi:MAG: sigma-54-dependent Fis family transcriptional regulator [Candidatus Schekmanbacteria bacterium]|nr:sigma-54-dependent Fis family transcriptional regulator [Candidatus Schekmanbacteria bacterium]
MGDGNSRILIVNQEKELAEDIFCFMTQEGFTALLAPNADKALELLSDKAPSVMLLDDSLTDMDGIELLKQIKSIDKNLPIILMTVNSRVHRIGEAMKLGVYDYLIKPFQKQSMMQMVQRAVSSNEPKKTQQHQLREMMGQGEAIGRLIDNLSQVADSDFSVVLLGETGSGKELVANAIHKISKRSTHPFVPVDCGAIPENLIESELFGHEKGAFTSADQQKTGKFEMAHGGTLFLDEISNMPFGSQAKLLRVLQDKIIYRVGGNKPIAVDVRMIVASNQDLESAIAFRSFRRDLFYRLNDFSIVIPSLRERKEDIVYLAYRFLCMTNDELGKKVREFSQPALDDLLAYHWPGNVRQLRSTIRRAVLLADDLITQKHLNMHSPIPNINEESGTSVNPANTAATVPKTSYGSLSLKEIITQNILLIEKEVLLQTLRHTGGNKAKAARLLKINYKTMHTKLKKHNISLNDELRVEI